uniref:Pentatricopeptide repeat domain 2 n=1 Tax=Felis catus TaxID=9685 RepID=A0ABI7YAU5_FELCA
MTEIHRYKANAVLTNLIHLQHIQRKTIQFYCCCLLVCVSFSSWIFFKNSPESLKICTTLREEALIKGEVLSRRASCFAVALALNQNQVAKAISIFSQIMKPESIICTNLNILIHIQSNMLKTLIKILKDAADGNLSKFVKRQEFSEEVLAKARKKVKDVPALLAKFDEIYGKLHINGQVTTCTLDTLLCHTPGDRKSHMVLLSKRTVSHRTFQPLSQSLWAE